MLNLRSFFLVTYLISGVFFFADGQELDCKWLSFEQTQGEFYLDSLSVLESSIRVLDKNGKGRAFTYDINSGKIRLESNDATDPPDSLQFCYQRLPYRFHSVYAKRSLMVDYDSNAVFKDNRVKATEVFDFREEIFPSSNLNKSGNLTRGISFGNAQNVFVNSSLNLQMDGQLADNLHIRASITDQNVPFQPEGNTQQIQDFDNVLIELYNDKFNLAAGDIVLQQRRSEFLRYYKNVQGLQFTSDYQMNSKWRASTQAGASVAKGRFASVQLEILEGVLGPYRIRGPQNERFVIVMANSERVFLDGRQLKRGFNYDYVIDYNQGEITFTTNVIITQYSRVRIDYEFSERNFTRSILTANHIQETDKVSFYINYYREQDNRNRPLFFEFSDADKQLLASVGNDVENAAVPRVDSIAFDPNRIMYKRVLDVLPSGETLQYYAYSTDRELAHFVIGFTEVGQGKGDYIRRQQLANGTVYEFVPPVGGNSQGNYSILSALPAPNKKQMITAGTRIKLSPYEQVYTEVALSNQDQNLFSEIGNENNTGLAIKSGIQSENRQLSILKSYRIKSMIEMEYNSASFSFIDRLRYIEFDRDWSLDQGQLEQPGSERILVAGFEAVKNIDNLLSYHFNFRNRGNVLNGTQQRAKWNQNLGSRFFIKNDVFVLNSDVSDFNSKWLRYSGEVKYRSKIFIPGYFLEIDQNEVRNQERDSVVSTAMNFVAHQFFLKSNDTLPYSFFADATWREDQFPINGEMMPDTRAFTTNYGLQKVMGKHDVKGTFTFRKLSFIEKDLQDETTIMGRLDYLGNLMNNNFRNELSYAIANGRELRREFVFLPVPTGEGTHTWRDDNNDGIQQLNEFYLAINPEEKNFIKVFVPTDVYIQAYTTLFNYRLNAKFPDDWRENGGLKKFLQRFSNNTSWNVEKKITANDFWSRISPFTSGIGDEDLISVRQVFRSTFFFNRASAKYGFDMSYFDSQNKQLLSGGFEDLIHQDWRLNTRFNFNSNLNFRFLLNQGSRISASDFLDNRNYWIRQNGMGPELSWQPSSVFRATSTYHFTHKINLANSELEEVSRLHQVGFDMRYAKAIKTTLNGNLNYTYISYNGNVNSPTGYEMLQALTLGNNFLWSLNWLQKIGEGLQLNMVYEGRNSQGLDRVIHTGRMQVSALF
ncbi:hypothetical protein [Pararhodonellum marinum]|uniref:hypothetical protein n=1 Tax=Pararhodonellum marinum TaxID=2755358 RepID=UPI001E63D392|nr:hypothetical protein [Pararhodonellum marinum]